MQADLSGRAEEEVELDMDTLPNDTLWRLHAYVRSLSRRAVPQAGAPNKTAAAVGVCQVTCVRMCVMQWFCDHACP
eukprot:scaffold268716_cov17-Tisochrysis_lutea.AAC.1